MAEALNAPAQDGAPTETQVAEPITLDAVLDLAAAPGLARQLLAARGQDLALDAGQVRRLGGLCLQVLLSAASTWAEDGRLLQLVRPSADCLDALRLFGAASHPIARPLAEAP